MDREHLQNFLEENIPLFNRAGFKILEFDSRTVRVSGKLKENKNPHNTVFGGSISVILLIAAWSKVLELMEQNNLKSSIVISSQNIKYLKPVKGDFSGVALTPETGLVETFLNQFNSQGKGTLTVEASLFQNGSNIVCATFEGIFYIKNTDPL